MHVEVPREDGTVWTKIGNKEEVESHLIDRNVKQFSHAGNTPFGYTDLGKELGHTGDSDMCENILNGTLEHECMDNEAIRAIFGQLKRHPTIQGILKPIVTTADSPASNASWKRRPHRFQDYQTPLLEGS
jgi:hypothetical protein